MEFYAGDEGALGYPSQLKYVAYVRCGLRSENHVLFKK
jgi:hypothetical protein